MTAYIQKRKTSLSYRILCGFIAFSFIFTLVLPPQVAAQIMPASVLNLPVPGTMVTMSSGFIPPLVKGITIHPENPLMFDFIVDSGESYLEGEELKAEADKMIKYFLASLTVPEDEMWVNLSPYEKDRIIPDSFGLTMMGRDLLAQDYLLKQLTASLMYPEEDLGSKFWARVYDKAYEMYGTTEIPMNTFNKIWIIPETAVVFEKGNSAYVVESHLKVMLEEDYLALQENLGSEKFSTHVMDKSEVEVISGVTSQVVKEVLIPEIEREVNEGETFANLRQIYNSMILATWFKKNLKDSLLGQVYVDKNKTKGVDVEDEQIKQKIYDQYVEAFSKGVYNYIKEDIDPVTNQMIPRKYFSGGFTANKITQAFRKIYNLEDMHRKAMDPAGSMLVYQALLVENAETEHLGNGIQTVTQAAASPIIQLSESFEIPTSIEEMLSKAFELNRRMDELKVLKATDTTAKRALDIAMVLGDVKDSTLVEENTAVRKYYEALLDFNVQRGLVRSRQSTNGTKFYSARFSPGILPASAYERKDESSSPIVNVNEIKNAYNLSDNAAEVIEAVLKMADRTVSEGAIKIKTHLEFREIDGVINELNNKFSAKITEVDYSYDTKVYDFEKLIEALEEVQAASSPIAPEVVQRNIDAGVITSDEHLAAIDMLEELNQGQLFNGWEEPGISDENKRAFLDEIIETNNGYPGGLKAYQENAVRLLEASARGDNPFEGFKPEIPQGYDLSGGANEEYVRLENVGLLNANKLGVVLVAGGMGERLGYSGIKVGIAFDMATERTYLEHYAQQILAFQGKSNDINNENYQIPLVIMTSGLTHDRTVQLLEENNYFGLDALSINPTAEEVAAGEARQVIILKQGAVPAITDNAGGFLVDPNNAYELQVKPHGHGDIHMLLAQAGIIRQWNSEGRTHTVFIQDTNGQVFNAVLPGLAASIENNLDFNFLTVSRDAGEAAGSIVNLVHEDGRSMTVNVEYNELDPLLRATINPEGDVPDPNTGLSPYPANLNVFIAENGSYADKLEQTKGIIAEFVNPKYADETRTKFKKPTRLETMMQDYAKELREGQQVGFTNFGKRDVFSAVKNMLSDAAEKAKSGNYPDSMSTGESDYYKYNRKMLQLAGVDVDVEGVMRTSQGVPFNDGAKVVLNPDFVSSISEVRRKVKGGSVSDRSFVIIEGEGIILENVNIDGTLHVNAVEGVQITLRDLNVTNDGWQLVDLSENELIDENIPEYIRIRGYKLVKSEELNIVIDQQGSFTVTEQNGQIVLEENRDGVNEVVSVLKTSSSSPIESFTLSQDGQSALIAPNLYFELRNFFMVMPEGGTTDSLLVSDMFNLSLHDTEALLRLMAQELKFIEEVSGFDTGASVIQRTDFQSSYDTSGFLLQTRYIQAHQWASRADENIPFTGQESLPQLDIFEEFRFLEAIPEGGYYREGNSVFDIQSASSPIAKIENLDIAEEAKLRLRLNKELDKKGYVVSMLRNARNQTIKTVGSYQRSIPALVLASIGVTDRRGKETVLRLLQELNEDEALLSQGIEVEDVALDNSLVGVKEKGKSASRFELKGLAQTLEGPLERLLSSVELRVKAIENEKDNNISSSPVRKEDLGHENIENLAQWLSGRSSHQIALPMVGHIKAALEEKTIFGKKTKGLEDYAVDESDPGKRITITWLTRNNQIKTFKTNEERFKEMFKVLIKRSEWTAEDLLNSIVKKIERDKAKPIDNSRFARGSSPIAKTADVGGIDLNPALLDLQIRRDGNGVPLPILQQPIQSMDIEGFLPVIINVTPVMNLPMLLGLTGEEDDSESSHDLSYSSPADRKARFELMDV